MPKGDIQAFGLQLALSLEPTHVAAVRRLASRFRITFSAKADGVSKPVMTTDLWVEVSFQDESLWRAKFPVEIIGGYEHLVQVALPTNHRMLDFVTSTFNSSNSGFDLGFKFEGALWSN